MLIWRRWRDSHVSGPRAACGGWPPTRLPAGSRLVPRCARRELSPFLCRQTKNPRPTGRGFVWRRWRDSNSRRAFDPYTISNRARSTNYATSPRICSRRPYQLVSLPIIMHKMGKVKHDFIRFPLLLVGVTMMLNS